MAVRFCPGTTSEALVNGSSAESYLGLSHETTRAIVAVVDRDEGPDAGGPLCSGTFVAPSWVVTAGHCLEIASPAVTIAGDATTPSVTLPVVSSVRNPDVDVALLQVDASALPDAAASAGTGLAPISVGGARAALLARGDAVEMAGYGLTETSILGSLRFLVESITTIDSISITVSGFGASGGCDGDSGGPLLVRAADGSVEIAGVLSTGSASCTEEDIYERLDGIQGWVQSVTGAYTSGDRACGTITTAGRCLNDVAVWCASGQLEALDCSGVDACGWSGPAAGFRCVPSAADPCQGVDSVGACRDDVALQCIHGNLQQRPCGCSTCRLDGATGAPVCRGGS